VRNAFVAVLALGLLAAPALATAQDQPAQPQPPPTVTQPQQPPPPPPPTAPPPPPPYAAPAYPPPPPYTPPPPPFAPPGYTHGPTRAPYYIGFGIGYGNGSYSFHGTRVNYWDHHGAGVTPFQLAFQFEAGATLTHQLLLGGELSGLVSTASRAGVDSTLTVGQLLAVVTYFPFPSGRGLFLRGGAGFAGINSYVSDNFNFTYAHSDTYGLGLLGGLGYAWWLGRQFNLTVHGDVNWHAYTGNADAPSNSATFTGYIGFRWY